MNDFDVYLYAIFLKRFSQMTGILSFLFFFLNYFILFLLLYNEGIEIYDRLIKCMNRSDIDHENEFCPIKEKATQSWVFFLN